MARNLIHGRREDLIIILFFYFIDRRLHIVDVWVFIVFRLFLLCDIIMLEFIDDMKNVCLTVESINVFCILRMYQCVV